MTEPQQSPAPILASARFWLVVLGLAIAIWISYSEVRHYEFVNFDDQEYIVRNINAQQPLSAKSAAWAFSTLYMANWHPITWISYLADYSLYGLDAGGYHITNILLHILNCILIVLLLYKATGRFWGAVFIAFLFAVHPQHVESVAWISERKDMLSMLFLLLTLFAWFDYGKKNARASYFLALIAFAFGLMAKPMLVTIPFALLLFDHWPLQRLDVASGKWYSYLTAYFSRKNLRLWIEKIPFFVLAFSSSFVTVIAQKHAGAVSSTTALSFLPRVFNAIQSYGIYIYKTFVPSNLAVFYPYPKTLNIITISAIGLALLLFTIYALSQHSKRPYIITGWLFYIGTLVPVIGIIQVGSQALADRYVLIPHLGLFIIIVYSINELLNGKKALITATAIGSVAIIIFFIIQTRSIVPNWQNSETLFKRVLAVCGPNRTAFHNLSAYYIDKGKYQEALQCAKNAVREDPSSAGSTHNIALAYERLRQYDSAAYYYKHALELDPGHSLTYGRLGVAYCALGNMFLAKEWFVKAYTDNPGSALNCNNLGAYYLKSGVPDSAIAYFSRAIQLDPALGLTYENMALVMLNIGKYAEAETFLDRALQFNPESPVVNKYKGDMYILRAQYDSALIYFSASLKSEPMNRDVQIRMRDLLARPELDSLSAVYEQEQFNLGIFNDGSPGT